MPREICCETLFSRDRHAYTYMPLSDLTFQNAVLSSSRANQLITTQPILFKQDLPIPTIKILIQHHYTFWPPFRAQISEAIVRGLLRNKQRHHVWLNPIHLRPLGVKELILSLHNSSS